MNDLPNGSAIELPMHLDVVVRKWIRYDFAKNGEFFRFRLEILFVGTSKLRLEVNVENARVAGRCFVTLVV